MRERTEINPLTKSKPVSGLACCKDKHPIHFPALQSISQAQAFLGIASSAPEYPQTRSSCMDACKHCSSAGCAMVRGAVHTGRAPSPGVMDASCLTWPVPDKGHKWGKAGKLTVMLPGCSCSMSYLGAISG